VRGAPGLDLGCVPDGASQQSCERFREVGASCVSPFAMRGVTILGPGLDGRAAWSRFYMESVDQAGDDVRSAVRDAVGTRP